MNRLTFIEIGGNQYPLSFSLGMLRGISKKFGSFNKVEEAMNKIEDEMTEESIDVISYLIYMLIKQGVLFCNTFGKGMDLPENTPQDENGKITPLTQEEVEVGLSMGNIEEAMKAISEAMTKGAEKTLSVEDGDSKNEIATHQI